MQETVIPFVDLKAQYRSIATSMDEAIRIATIRGDYILGADVGAFEQEFAKYTGTKFAIGVGTGLDAIFLSLLALGVTAGDEVLLPANTFIATALAVSQTGARPVLIDCDPRTFNMDVEQISKAITSRTKAIIPVHLTGQSVDMEPLRSIADQHGIQIVEDACQAHGARYKGIQCGAMGQAGCFSFYPGKNLGGYGDGGAVTTDNHELFQKICRLRNYGQSEKYYHSVRGTNSRLDTLQAAILRVKLPHLDAWNEARIQNAKLYRKWLAGIGDIVLQHQIPDTRHVHHLFIIQTSRRSELAAHLSRLGIQTGIHYPRPIHLQEAYQDLGYRLGDFPNTERLAEISLSLPMYPELSAEQIILVTDAIKDFFRT